MPPPRSSKEIFIIHKNLRQSRLGSPQKWWRYLQFTNKCHKNQYQNNHLFISKLGDLYEHFPTFIVKTNIVRKTLSGTIWKTSSKAKGKGPHWGIKSFLCRRSHHCLRALCLMPFSINYAVDEGQVFHQTHLQITLKSRTSPLKEQGKQLESSKEGGTYHWTRDGEFGIPHVSWWSWIKGDAQKTANDGLQSGFSHKPVIFLSNPLSVFEAGNSTQKV